MNLTVWRYMPFTKFISLLVYQALWFSKLNILQDQYEGLMPFATKRMMDDHHHELKKGFPPEHHWQFDEMSARNEKDSRELKVVNCWFLGDCESERMWREYGEGKESVVIKSTVKQLIEQIGVPRDKDMSSIGRVNYVDFKSHMMSKYHANQGSERAYLKDAETYQHEKEIRIVTMSFKTLACVNPEGKPYTKEEIQKTKMNNFENPGLYIQTRLQQLISEIRIHPEADNWFYLLVKRIVENNKWQMPVNRSKLSNT